MCVTDRHDMTLAVKVALNSNTINQFGHIQNFVIWERVKRNNFFLRVFPQLLSNDTIMGMSKFKASADNKLGVAEIMGFVFERVENIVGKGFLLWVIKSRV